MNEKVEDWECPKTKIIITSMGIVFLFFGVLIELYRLFNTGSRFVNSLVINIIMMALGISLIFAGITEE